MRSVKEAPPMTPEREAEMSLHEETCSDATKLAREIHEDVMGGVEEIARAIQAGFDYREGRLRSSLATADREAKNAKALAVARGKAVKKCRDMFINIKDELEDEADRIYFGSTNHADDFKQCVDELDSWNWQAIIDEGKIADIYEISRKAHEQLRATESRAASLEALLAETRENQAASQRMTASVERSLARSIALHESAEALLDEAVKAVKELADDLSEWVEHHYAKTKVHPSEARRYERDIDPVVRARALLARIEAREGGEDSA